MVFSRVFHDDSPLYDDFSSVKIKNALNCRRSSGRTKKSVVPPEFGSLHNSRAANGASGGHFLPQLRAATPIIACNASRVSCFPPSVKGKLFQGLGALPPEAQKKNCWEKWAVGDIKKKLLGTVGRRREKPVKVPFPHHRRYLALPAYGS